jgi:hypothetical protein
MKLRLILAALLLATGATAQTSAPPAESRTGAAPKARPQSLADRLQACLEIEDGSKERLDCYDAVIKPKPKAKVTKAKSVMDCAFPKEEDERLACFNGFVEKLPPKT